MLNGFEKYTYDLTVIETERIIPFLVTLLNKQQKGKKHAINNQTIQKELKKFYLLEKIDREVREARIRKYIFYIRYHGLVPDLIANSKGYYKANSNEEVDNWLDSITGRIEALNLIYKSISNGRKLQLF